MLRWILQKERERVLLDPGRAIKLFIVESFNDIILPIVYTNAKNNQKQLFGLRFVGVTWPMHTLLITESINNNWNLTSPGPQSA